MSDPAITYRRIQAPAVLWMPSWRRFELVQGGLSPETAPLMRLCAERAQAFGMRLWHLGLNKAARARSDCRIPQDGGSFVERGVQSSPLCRALLLSRTAEPTIPTQPANSQARDVDGGSCPDAPAAPAASQPSAGLGLGNLLAGKLGQNLY